MARTAGNILTNVRAHIEETSAGYWTDSELYKIMANKQDDLWRRVVQLKQDLFVNPTPATLTMVAGTSKYTIASDFYLVKSIRTTTSGQEGTTWRPVDAADPEFLNGLRSDITVTNPSEYLYAILGNNTIQVSPTPQAAGTAVIEYVQLPTEIAGSGDTFTLPDQFLNFIEYATTAEALAKGPVGDMAYWDGKAEREWQTILLDLGGPRQQSGPDVVLGMFNGAY